MSIKQDTMNEVKIQDINTKYVLLSITGFRVKKKQKPYLIGKIFLLLKRQREKHLTCIKRTNWVRKQ